MWNDAKCLQNVANISANESTSFNCPLKFWKLSRNSDKIVWLPIQNFIKIEHRHGKICWKSLLWLGESQEGRSSACLPTRCWQNENQTKCCVGDSVRRGLGLQVRRGGGLLLAEDAIEEALARTTRPRAPAKTGNSCARICITTVLHSESKGRSRFTRSTNF